MKVKYSKSSPKVQASLSQACWHNETVAKGKKKNKQQLTKMSFINMLWQDQQLCRLYEDLQVPGDNSSTHIVF